MPRVGRKRKKRRTEKEMELSDKEKKIPRCFVLKRGNIGQRVKDLVQDFRMVMLPNCAKSLKESKMNRVEDFIAVSGHYGVSHLIIFTGTKLGTYLKLAKLPQGPTLTFKIMKFSLARDVRAAQKRPRSGARDYTSAPLQVLNGFGGAGSDGGAAKKSNPAERQLMAEMLRGLFPSIDVPTFNSAECRRVALFHREGEKDLIEFRHYAVSRRQSGLGKGVSALLNPSRLPKLSRNEDISDLVLGNAASDSEAEDMEADSTSGGKVAIRLTEVGPRLELQLVKCEEGVLTGAVLFHRYLTRTPTEQEVLEQRARQRRKLKERNAKLDQAARENNAKLKRKKQDRLKAEAKRERKEAGEAGDGYQADGFVGAGDSDSEREAGRSKTTNKPQKKRFHPFAWGAKAGKPSTEKTVEIDGKPSKPKNNRAGRRQKESAEFGKGKKGGKGDGKGGGKGGKGGTAQKVMDRFQNSQKKRKG